MTRHGGEGSRELSFTWSLAWANGQLVAPFISKGNNRKPGWGWNQESQPYMFPLKCPLVPPGERLHGLMQTQGKSCGWRNRSVSHPWGGTYSHGSVYMWSLKAVGRMKSPDFFSAWSRLWWSREPTVWSQAAWGLNIATSILLVMRPQVRKFTFLSLCSLRFKVGGIPASQATGNSVQYCLFPSRCLSLSCIHHTFMHSCDASMWWSKLGSEHPTVKYKYRFLFTQSSSPVIWDNSPKSTAVIRSKVKNTTHKI